MSKRVKLRQVAQELGISLSAVSKAINGKDDISAELKTRVFTKMQELGYSPTSVNWKRPDEYKIKKIMIFFSYKKDLLKNTRSLNYLQVFLKEAK